MNEPFQGVPFFWEVPICYFRSRRRPQVAQELLKELDALQDRYKIQQKHLALQTGVPSCRDSYRQGY